MTISNQIHNATPRKIHDTYDLQSPKDKAGMKGDRAMIHTTDTYQPQGASSEILRRAGSLRLVRGDCKVSTLASTYREFSDLAVIQKKIAESASGAIIGLPLTLADLRQTFGEVSITKIRAAIREA